MLSISTNNSLNTRYTGGHNLRGPYRICTSADESTPYLITNVTGTTGTFVNLVVDGPASGTRIITIPTTPTDSNVLLSGNLTATIDTSTTSVASNNVIKSAIDSKLTKGGDNMSGNLTFATGSIISATDVGTSSVSFTGKNAQIIPPGTANASLQTYTLPQTVVDQVIMTNPDSIWKTTNGAIRAVASASDSICPSEKATSTELVLKAPLASPMFSGIPKLYGTPDFYTSFTASSRDMTFGFQTGNTAPRQYWFPAVDGTEYFMMRPMNQFTAGTDGAIRAIGSASDLKCPTELAVATALALKPNATAPSFSGIAYHLAGTQTFSIQTGGLAINTVTTLTSFTMLTGRQYYLSFKNMVACMTGGTVLPGRYENHWHIYRSVAGVITIDNISYPQAISYSSTVTLGLSSMTNTAGVIALVFTTTANYAVTTTGRVEFIVANQA
jgi:hypothetical protein